jgi:hypothetical protein
MTVSSLNQKRAKTGVPLMPSKCPLCSQPLPEAINENELQDRIQKLASPVLAVEKKKLNEEFETQLVAEREIARQRAERQFQQRLRAAEERAQRAEKNKEKELQRLQKDYSERLAGETESAKQNAERSVKRQLLEAEKRAKDADDRRQKEVEQARKEVENRLEKEVARTIRLTTRENEAKLDKLQSDRERDKVRHEANSAKLQGQLDDLSRKLEKQSGEQLGSEAELDLFTELKHEFSKDRIERIGRGVRGADIVHEVMDGAKVVGRIIYESKNTSDWNKSFIAQAKKYQTQYETPHVLIVTRVFPSTDKGLCVVKGIPVVERRTAVALATIIREGIIEVAKLRLSGKFHDEKSQELFEYIVGHKFCTRFREMAESIASLREQQQKERTWHENAWQAESKIHERIEGRHREVDAQIRAIVRGSSDGATQKLGVKPEMWRDSNGGVRHTETAQ